jgi:hypothetical protein
MACHDFPSVRSSRILARLNNTPCRADCGAASGPVRPSVLSAGHDALTNDIAL